MHRHDRPTPLPPLQLHQGRHRADDARALQGPGRQGHRRQRRRAGPDGHGALLQRQIGAGVEDDCGLQPDGTDRAAGGGGGGDCVVEWRGELVGERAGD